MNYEELLETRDSRKTNRLQLPYGYFYKRLIDGKYSNFVEFHDELSDNITFANCVRREHDALAAITSRHQLHYTPNEGNDGIYAIAVEPGNYISFEQLLNDSPQVVARKDFIRQTIADLGTLTEQLNAQGIYHLCFAPSNVLVRKHDASIRLLLHGSSYLSLGMQEVIFDGLEDYVAPEVINSGIADERSDVYSLARFVEYLYASSGLPFEQKHVIEKATQADPEARYATVADLLHDLRLRSLVRTVATWMLVAVALFLLGLAVFADLTPKREQVEFVDAVDEPLPEDLLDEGFNPFTELGPDADSATIAQAIADYLTNDSGKLDQKKLREYQSKAEQIFRKQYTKAADIILSRIYNNERMNISEKQFMAQSEEVMKELVEMQHKLARTSALSEETAQRIASEIIDQVTAKKKAEMEQKPNYGFQQRKDEEPEVAPSEE